MTLSAPLSLPPTRLIPVPGHGPEDVVVDRDGWVVTGLDDGRVVRIDPDTGESQLLAHTGGRPLGLELYPDGRILICDTRLGLLSADPATGIVTTLVDRIDGIPLRFCNNAAIASDGTVYFSDSSRRYGIEQWKRDIIENIPTGRLLRRRPDGQVDVLLDRLYFANGVALAADESWVLVAESGSRRINRVWLKGPKAGRAEVFFENLPGVPDNLSTGADGLVWVALAAPADKTLALLHGLPLTVRRLAARLPEAIQPDPQRVVWVMALDGDGHIVRDLRWTSEPYHMVTGMREHRGKVYIGSIDEDAILVFDLPAGS
jgi:sugar lactone lactonase YvrE